jgi:hypothetical protein
MLRHRPESVVKPQNATDQDSLQHTR